MHSSLFARVTRYPVSATVNPRENRLTEVTAAALEHVDGLARTFASHLLDAGVEDAQQRMLSPDELKRREDLAANAVASAAARVQVNTQVATSRGRFIDLEVLLRPAVGASEAALLVWVEVKYGADLHGDQLDAYLNDIRMRPIAGPVRRVVVLLAPRGWTSTATTVPDDVLIADWQGVGKTMKTALSQERPPEQRWLLSEYVRYLKEENLSDPDALTAMSALVLMETNSAWDAVAGICEHVDAVAQSQWGARGKHLTSGRNDPVPDFGPGYWAEYAPHRGGEQPATTWRGAGFEWGMRETFDMEGLDDARGSWAFMAGVTLVTKSNPRKLAANEQWLARLASAGFRYFWIDGFYRLARLRYPDELLAETTLEAQGRAVGAWVVDAFGVLADDPPDA